MDRPKRVFGIENRTPTPTAIAGHGNGPSPVVAIIENLQ